MCGIAGFIGFESNVQLAENSNVIQKHRGPDSQMTWHDNYISLAHQRLSIIDLSDRSNQPFEKHNYVIVYNGELYNYKSIQKKLIQNYNISFKTDCDTEVVLEAYIRMGPDCLKDFVGMFAFCIYNKNNNELFMVRDHFGIKPLHYFFDPEKKQFAFASELKTLLPVINDKKNDINISALIKLVNYLWLPGNDSIFKSIKKLDPGSYAVLTENKLIIKEYWNLKEKHNETDYLQLRKIIEDSIDRHMVSDVPVNTFLSGGLDSSLISVLAKKRTKSLETYTIGISDKDKLIEQMPEDDYYAAKLAKEFGFDHNEIKLDASIVNLLPEIVYTLDEPIGDPAAINTFLICKQARKKGVKVLLSGMGADELFGGYRKHLAVLYAERYKKIPVLFRKIIRILSNFLPVRLGKRGIRITRWLKRFLSFADLNTEKSFRRSYSYYSDKDLKKLFNVNIEKELNELNEEHSRLFYKQFKGDVINQMCYTDIHMFMQGLNLTYTDRASMAASVEVRVPFIDKIMVETAMGISGQEKIKDKISKYILKKSAEAYLPSDIIYRPKAAFGAPIRSWISNDLKEMVDDLLSKESVENRGFFNYGLIKKIIEDDRNGLSDNAYQIYQLLTIELWFRRFIDVTNI